MAEEFRGKNHSVHTSNNGGKELLKSLIEVGQRLNQDTNLQQVLFFLTQQLKSGYGSFSLNPQMDFPDAFQNTKNIKALTLLIEAIANKLLKPEPKLSWDIQWNRTNRIRWLAKLSELHEMCLDLLSISDKAKKFDIKLNKDDANLYHYFLLTDYYTELCRRHPNEGEQQKLKLLNQLLPIISMIPHKKEEMLLRYMERTDIFISIGDTKSAVQDLKICISLTDDSKEKKWLKSYIAALK